MSKVIAIKHGTEHNFKEAHANLDTGEVEETCWEEGPTNAFYNGGVDKPQVGGGDKQYDEGYKRIFKHE